MTPGERDRDLVRTVQEAEWRRRMLRAGGIDPERLSEQARRILAWLAEWDDWTTGGVIELLGAAHQAGHDAAVTEPEPTAHHRRDRARGLDSITTRPALQHRPQAPELGL